MKVLAAVPLLAVALALTANASPVARLEIPEGGRVSKHLRPVLEKRDSPQFAVGEPISGNGKGAPISGRSCT